MVLCGVYFPNQFLVLISQLMFPFQKARIFSENTKSKNKTLGLESFSMYTQSIK